MDISETLEIGFRDMNLAHIFRADGPQDYSTLDHKLIFMRALGRCFVASIMTLPARWTLADFDIQGVSILNDFLRLEVVGIEAML